MSLAKVFASNSPWFNFEVQVLPAYQSLKLEVPLSASCLYLLSLWWGLQKGDTLKKGYVDHSARVMHVITWNRSFRGVPNGEGGKDDVDSEDYETHATVLDKLLA